jgi:hypothetical protein
MRKGPEPSFGPSRFAGLYRLLLRTENHESHRDLQVA